MDNKELLKELSHAMKIAEGDMVSIFELGDIAISKEEVESILSNPTDEDNNEGKDNNPCTNVMLESFLNGLIIYKRGPKENKSGEDDKPKLAINIRRSINNVVLKKLKIALSLNSEDMLTLMEIGGVEITKHDLSSIFRKEGHKHYKSCSDTQMRGFLSGVAKKTK